MSKQNSRPGIAGATQVRPSVPLEPDSYIEWAIGSDASSYRILPELQWIEPIQPYWDISGVSGTAGASDYQALRFWVDAKDHQEVIIKDFNIGDAGGSFIYSHTLGGGVFMQPPGPWSVRIEWSQHHVSGTFEGMLEYIDGTKGPQPIHGRFNLNITPQDLARGADQ